METNPSCTKWLYLTLLSLIWGSSFILIKKGLTGFGYFEAATTRLMSVEVQSAVAAMLNGLTPVFTFVFSIIIFKIAFKANQVLGMLLGLACAILLAIERSDSELSFNWHASAESTSWRMNLAAIFSTHLRYSSVKMSRISPFSRLDE